MTAPIWLAVAAAAGLAACLQASIGVGFALVMSPLLAVLAPELLPGSVLLLMLPLNMFVAWRERAALDRRGAGWITLGRLAGTLAGLAVLVALSAGTLRPFVGAATLLTVAGALWRSRFVLRPPLCVLAGVITGITETATGIGGPPLALLYQHQPASVLRATLATCFLLGEVASLALLLAVGRLDAAQCRAALFLLAPLGVGAWASRWLHGRVGGPLLRVAMLVFAALSGVLCLV